MRCSPTQFCSESRAQLAHRGLEIFSVAPVPREPKIVRLDEGEANICLDVHVDEALILLASIRLALKR